MAPTEILACQPVDEAVRARLERLVGKKLTRYSHTVQGTCAQCDAPILLGPKQQELAAKGIPTWCYSCTARLAAENPDDIEAVSLGNPEGDLPNDSDVALP